MTARETNVTRGGLRARATEVGAAVEHRLPGLVRLLVAARWGGLRTVHPTPLTWSAVAGAGATAGLALRETSARTLRHRPPVAPSVVAGVAGAWLALWRWDAARFARTRVTLVPDLAPEALQAVVEHLDGAGITVETWEGPRRADGRVRGLVCRVRDVRTVNRTIDEWGSGPARRGLQDP